MALYEQNAKVVHALFDSLENEDLETASSFFAEEAKFNPPAYEGEDLDKKGIIDNYNGFMQILDNIKTSIQGVLYNKLIERIDSAIKMNHWNELAEIIK